MSLFLLFSYFIVSQSGYKVLTLYCKPVGIQSIETFTPNFSVNERLNVCAKKINYYFIFCFLFKSVSVGLTLFLRFYCKSIGIQNINIFAPNVGPECRCKWEFVCAWMCVQNRDIKYCQFCPKLRCILVPVFLCVFVVFGIVRRRDGLFLIVSASDECL